jgi:hypothetical protein
MLNTGRRERLPLTQSRQMLLLGTDPGMLAVLASLGCGNASGFDASLTQTMNLLVANYSVMVPPTGGVAWVEFGPRSEKCRADGNAS